jgi:membrane protein implicated in regulation of membrane protease activity
MALLGLILLIVGLLIGSAVLLWIGVILLVVGLVANFAPGPWAGPAGGARRRYW